MEDAEQRLKKILIGHVCLAERSLPQCCRVYNVCQHIFRTYGSKKRDNVREVTIPPTPEGLSGSGLCSLVSPAQVLNWRANRSHASKRDRQITLLATGKDHRKDSSKPLSKVLASKVEKRKLDMASASDSAAYLSVKISKKRGVSQKVSHSLRSQSRVSKPSRVSNSGGTATIVKTKGSVKTHTSSVVLVDINKHSSHTKH